jgi:glycerol-3-phosphate dehydrogenase (NAD(P)+)
MNTTGDTPEGEKAGAEKNGILVVGAGAWGTALALHLSRHREAPVFLYGRDREKIAAMTAARANIFYLPKFPFPDNLIPTHDLTLASRCRWLLLALPSYALSTWLRQWQPLQLSLPIVLASKGLHPETQFLYQALESALPAGSPVAVLSGPSFAEEVAAEKPTALVLAAALPAAWQAVIADLHRGRLRIYHQHDRLGVSLGGALKNILAIAAGISDGLGLGSNARAALLTRGLAEMQRLASVFGAEAPTVVGLSGLGDLLLTATDDLSRNRRFGLLLGQGCGVSEALARIGTVEGYHSALLAWDWLQRYPCPAPIITAVAQVLQQKISPEQALQLLLERQQRSEF